MYFKVLCLFMFNYSIKLKRKTDCKETMELGFLKLAALYNGSYLFYGKTSEFQYKV